MKTLGSVAIAVALLMTTTADARADDGNNKVAAEATFDEGLALFDKGHYAEACAKFAASQKLEAASGTLLNLARCYEKMGKTASAWSAFRDAQALARKEGNAKREAFAHAQEAAIQKKLAKMTVTIAHPAPGLVVSRDDEPIDAAVWGTAVPIDPGSHVVVAKAPGKKDWQLRVDITEAQATVVDVPALEDASSANPTPETGPSSSPRAPPSEGLETTRVLALAAGGVGVVALGVGTFFGLSAISSSDDAKPHCELPRPCDDTGHALRDDARSQADISTVSFIAGGVLVVGAAVLWFVLPSSSARVRASASGLYATF